MSAGSGICGLCQEVVHPGESEVKRLSVSTAVLSRNQAYRGYCLVIFNKHETELEHLTRRDQIAFYEDMLTISHAVYSALRPDKMNYELLGNWGNHLHWHVIPRYRDDPWWGNPIWIDAHPTEKRLKTVKNLDKEGYRRIKEAILEKL